MGMYHLKEILRIRFLTIFYRFGAVVDEDVFESLLRQALGARPGEA